MTAVPAQPVQECGIFDLGYQAGSAFAGIVGCRRSRGHDGGVVGGGRQRRPP